MIANSRGAQAPDEEISISPIPITDQVPWYLVSGEGFGDLSRYPIGSRVIGHAIDRSCLRPCLRMQNGPIKPNWPSMVALT